MVQCEMCGKGVISPKSMKIEGAVLQVCQACSRFGVETPDLPGWSKFVELRIAKKKGQKRRNTPIYTPHARG